ncbi:hypothetical protein A2U01_0110285, partial [Trifolium medium]|nr:hypothetical protein [Trifolium medium]
MTRKGDQADSPHNRDNTLANQGNDTLKHRAERKGSGAALTLAEEASQTDCQC